MTPTATPTAPEARGRPLTTCITGTTPIATATSTTLLVQGDGELRFHTASGEPVGAVACERDVAALLQIAPGRFVANAGGMVEFEVSDGQVTARDFVDSDGLVRDIFIGTRATAQGGTTTTFNSNGFEATIFTPAATFVPTSVFRVSVDSIDISPDGSRIAALTDTGVWLLDVDDPSDPVQIAEIGVPRFNTDASRVGLTTFVDGERALVWIDAATASVVARVPAASVRQYEPLGTGLLFSDDDGVHLLTRDGDMSLVLPGGDADLVAASSAQNHVVVTMPGGPPVLVARDGSLTTIEGGTAMRPVVDLRIVRTQAAFTRQPTPGRNPGVGVDVILVDFATGRISAFDVTDAGSASAAFAGHDGLVVAQTFDPSSNEGPISWLLDPADDEPTRLPASLVDVRIDPSGTLLAGRVNQSDQAAIYALPDAVLVATIPGINVIGWIGGDGA